MLDLSALTVDSLLRYLNHECKGCLNWKQGNITFKLIAGSDYVAIINRSTRTVTQIPYSFGLDSVIALIATASDSPKAEVEYAFAQRCLTAKYITESLSRNKPVADMIYRMDTVVTLSICGVYEVDRLSVTFNKVGSDKMDSRRIYIETTPFQTILQDIFIYLLDTLPDKDITMSEITENVLYCL